MNLHLTHGSWKLSPNKKIESYVKETSFFENIQTCVSRPELQHNLTVKKLSIRVEEEEKKTLKNLEMRRQERRQNGNLVRKHEKKMKVILDYVVSCKTSPRLTSLIFNDGVERLELEPLRLLGRSELLGPKLSSLVSPFVRGEPFSYKIEKDKHHVICSH